MVEELSRGQRAEPVARANAYAWHVGCGAAFGAKHTRGSSITFGKVVISFYSLPLKLQEKVRTLTPIDYDGSSYLVSLVRADGTRVKNVYLTYDSEVLKQPTAIREMDAMVDVVLQISQESVAEKDWWDPSNEEWWKS